MGVSKNTGTPKWMVKIMEDPIKMDDLGVKPPLFLVQHPYTIQMPHQHVWDMKTVCYPPAAPFHFPFPPSFAFRSWENLKHPWLGGDH